MDEGVPRRLGPLLRSRGCDVSHFPKDWKGLRNGELLRRMNPAGFRILLTCDKNLTFQQNLKQSKVSVIVLPAQRLSDLEPLAEIIATALRDARPGTVLKLGLGRNAN